MKNYWLEKEILFFLLAIIKIGQTNTKLEETSAFFSQSIDFSLHHQHMNILHSENPWWIFTKTQLTFTFYKLAQDKVAINLWQIHLKIFVWSEIISIHAFQFDQIVAKFQKWKCNYLSTTMLCGKYANIPFKTEAPLPVLQDPRLLPAELEAYGQSGSWIYQESWTCLRKKNSTEKSKVHFAIL